MRAFTRALRWSLPVTVVLVLLSSQGLVAQEMEQEGEAQAYWHVQLYQIPWERVDSLRTLVDRTQPVVDDAIENGAILDFKILIHEMGDEYNVVEMTKYPSWAAIQEDRGFGEAAEEVFDEATDEAIMDGFDWVYEGSAAHKDYIYTEATGGS